MAERSRFPRYVRKSGRTGKARSQAALSDWRDSNREFQATVLKPKAKADPAKYSKWLREHTAWISIRGLQVGTGKAHRFPIEDLYIPLKTVEAPEEQLPKKGRRRPQPSAEMQEGLGRLATVPLEAALRHRRLVIVGDPGSGKTTFLRRIAYDLCLSSATSQPPTRVIGEKLLESGFPLLLRIAELQEHIDNCRQRRDAGIPTTKESAAWLAHFLESRSSELQWDLDRKFFEQKLGEAETLVLLDGLDEATSRIERESMARLFENVAESFRECRLVVTTRPQAYSGESVLAGFHQVSIAELETEAIEGFLGHWSRRLYAEDPSGAKLTGKNWSRRCGRGWRFAAWRATR